MQKIFTLSILLISINIYAQNLPLKDLKSGIPVDANAQNQNVNDYVDGKIFECQSVTYGSYTYVSFDRKNSEVSIQYSKNPLKFEEIHLKSKVKYSFSSRHNQTKENQTLTTGGYEEFYLGKDDIFYIVNSKNGKTGSCYFKYKLKGEELDIEHQLKNIVEKKINKWQKKDEFEKLADYRKRVNETTREKLVKEFQAEAISNLSKVYSSSIDYNDIEIKEYDAENETFLFNSSAIGNFIIKVPISEAKEVKELYLAKLNIKFLNPQFVLINNKFVLSHIDLVVFNFYNYDKSKGEFRGRYSYNISDKSNYSQTKINYNFSDIEIDLPKTQVTTNPVAKTNKISVGKSDVDMDIPLNYKKNPHRYALIIGNEDYSSFQTGLSSEVNVDYAINDAKVFSEYCEKTLGVDSRHLKLLTNATYGQMKRAIAWVQNLSKIEGGNAEIIFYYSGHGLPNEVTKEGYLMPVDVSGNNVSNGISLKYLYQELNKYPAKEITVVLDACFSGGARNEGLVAMKGVKIKPKEDVVSGNMVVFASSSGNESSAVYREKQHGYLTYFLLKKIQETKGYVNYKDLSDYLDYQVRKETAIIGKVQTPKVNVSPSARDQWEYWSFR